MADEVWKLRNNIIHRNTKDVILPDLISSCYQRIRSYEAANSKFVTGGDDFILNNSFPEAIVRDLFTSQSLNYVYIAFDGGLKNGVASWSFIAFNMNYVSSSQEVMPTLEPEMLKNQN